MSIRVLPGRLPDPIRLAAPSAWPGAIGTAVERRSRWRTGDQGDSRCSLRQAHALREGAGARVADADDVSDASHQLRLQTPQKGAERIAEQRSRQRPGRSRPERWGDHSPPRVGATPTPSPFHACPAFTSALTRWRLAPRTSTSLAMTRRRSPSSSSIAIERVPPIACPRGIGHRSVHTPSRSLTSAHLHRDVNAVFTGCSQPSVHHWCTCPEVEESRHHSATREACIGVELLVERPEANIGRRRRTKHGTAC